MAWREEYNDIVRNLILDPFSSGKIFYLDPTHGSDGGDGSKKAPVKTLEAALAGVRNGYGDTIVYLASTSGITQAVPYHWKTNGISTGTTLNYTRLIGTGSGSWYGSRSRFFASASVPTTPMFTVAGIGNYFSDLYWSCDKNQANKNVVTVSGTYNRFDRCNFAGPLHATPGADTDFRTLIVTGGANTFKECIIGLDTASMSVANGLLSFGGAAVNHPMNIFENCLFLMQANAKSPFFIYDEGTTGQGNGSIFRHCTFANMRGQATTLSLAISWAEAGGGLAHVFDQCTFFGVDDIIATGNVSRVQFVKYGETAAQVGLMANPAV